MLAARWGIRLRIFPLPPKALDRFESGFVEDVSWHRSGDAWVQLSRFIDIVNDYNSTDIAIAGCDLGIFWARRAVNIARTDRQLNDFMRTTNFWMGMIVVGDGIFDNVRSASAIPPRSVLGSEEGVSSPNTMHWLHNNDHVANQVKAMTKHAT